MTLGKAIQRGMTAVALAASLSLAGCRKTAAPATDDASLNASVRSKLAGDDGLAGQNIEASVNSAVVTLDGTVTNSAARALAADDAAHIAGVKTVNNNLVLQAAASPGMAPTAAASVTTPPAMPIPVIPKKKQTTIVARHAPAPIERNAPPPPGQFNPQPEQPQQPDQQPQQQAAPPPPAPPAAPVVVTLTVPAGTTIPVRITQTLDSATTQTGDKFSGVVSQDIVIDGAVAIAQGSPITGHVDAVQEAAHFKGSSLLTISLSDIDRGGHHTAVTSDPFSKAGKGRGANTAEKVGGGAAVGAILGGIFGGGKGAAIGAAAGGGLGAGDQAITKGQQVQIPSETIVRFRLSADITVRTTQGGRNEAGSLERRPE